MKTREEIQKKILKEYQDYHGIDANFETSLFEYGLCVKYNAEENDYHCIFYVDLEDEIYVDSGWYGEEDVDIALDDMSDTEDFLSHLGQTREEWKRNDFVMKLYDLISWSWIVPFQYNFDVYKLVK
jgi:hypothetical protein